jgi:NAD(P)-dependent dehydrogenase (short-subunit alcohol dehydrogenase family)
MLEGRTILIVGSTAGIGADVYRLCIKHGAQAIGVGRNRQRGESMAGELGGRFMQADLGSERDVEELFASLKREGTGIDGAVIGMTRAAALDGAPSGIRVNAVLPGTTRTEMLDLQMRTRPGGLEGTIQRIPLGRVSEPREQAQAIVWLLSSASSFVTGECLTVDGGTSAKC